MSHPSVEAITYWGITDAGAWLGAPIGLVRADGTPKPSCQALHGLVKGEWWLAPTTVVTDADGRITVKGFSGEYQLSSGASFAAGAQPTRFTLRSQEQQIRVTRPSIG
ncbi:hypothetical protein [Cryobacterium sp. Y62]|uniref:hypothetical protein n=1 Tax=Cryobacterium sp. Y62 TaxID=2048284 RepID=UPI0034CE64A1